MSDDSGTLFIQKVISKPAANGYGFKFAIFGGLHGDEEVGVLAAHEIIHWAGSQPEELGDFELHVYPICNPSGHAQRTRHTACGLDINREFWVGSQLAEVQYLESELRRERYDGIIQLHSDDTSDGCYGFVSGSLLSEHLIEPALAAADRVIPRNPASVIDGFRAQDGVIRECYEGVLSAPPEQRPRPLEIVFETPALAPIQDQVEATLAAVRSILAGYRQLQAHAMNL